MSKTKVSTGLVLPKGWKEESVLCLSPSFRWFAGHLWHSLASAPISTFTFIWHFPLCVFTSSSLSACLSASKFALLIRTPVILDQGPTLLLFE